jgi:hypothetical protein
LKDKEEEEGGHGGRGVKWKSFSPILSLQWSPAFPQIPSPLFADQMMIGKKSGEVRQLKDDPYGIGMGVCNDFRSSP